MTRWKPDTCGCVIDVIDWDTAQGKTVEVCAAHHGLTDDAHLAAVYHGENKVKNLAMAALRKGAPSLFLTAADAAAANRSRLLAHYPSSGAHIDAMNDADVSAALAESGGRVAGEGDPHPGVKVEPVFDDSTVGVARALTLDVPKLTKADHAAVDAELVKLGVARK